MEEYHAVFTGPRKPELWAKVKIGARGDGPGRLLRALRFHERAQAKKLRAVTLYRAGYRKAVIAKGVEAKPTDIKYDIQPNVLERLVESLPARGLPAMKIGRSFTIHDSTLVDPARQGEDRSVRMTVKRKGADDLFDRTRPVPIADHAPDHEG